MGGVVVTHPSLEVTLQGGERGPSPLEAALRGDDGGGVVSPSQLEGNP